ncbi:MAG: NAD(P)-dependent oxidoreductase [Ruminococcus sp.]|nr:NAD(P)-dependent oxidoreductase [Ruminococcus sp.]
MLTDNSFYAEDVNYVLCQSGIDWEKFRNKSVFITGATGLIGAFAVNVLSQADEKFGLGIKLHLLIRSETKAQRLFGKRVENFILHTGDVETIGGIDTDVDYFIHAASQTSSKGFVDTPVETFRTSVAGTMNMLEAARSSGTKKFIFLSTMEVYGTPSDDRKISEDMKVSMLSSNVRNCYPISKIAAENLCCDYASEYGMDIAVFRLTQTFGPGIDYNDGRVFAEFARCAVEDRDIVLKTKGETKRSYLYTADAVAAILMVLTKENHGFEIYNAANEDTYCSIYEMAQLVAKECAGGRISVRIEEPKDIAGFGYAPTLCMNLDTQKLRRLGWNPSVGLKEMFVNLCRSMEETSENRNIELKY